MSQKKIFRTDAASTVNGRRPVDNQNRFQNRTVHLWGSTVLVISIVGLIGCGSSDSLQTQKTAPAITNVENRNDSAEAESTGNAIVGDDGDADATLAVGDKAPDFEIEGLGGESLRLSKYFGSAANGPTILLFDRAHW